MRILFPYIVYMRDDLCRIIRDDFQSFGKGCRIIRRAEFLEEVRYGPYGITGQTPFSVTAFEIVAFFGHYGSFNILDAIGV